MIYKQQRGEATEPTKHSLNIIDNKWEELKERMLKQEEHRHESAPQEEALKFPVK